MKALCLSIALGAVMAVGCSPTTSGTSTSTAKGETSGAKPLDPSMHELKSKDGSFTLAVPKDWASVDKSDPQYSAAMAKVGDPAAAKTVEQLAANPVLQLIAMDVKGIEARKAFVDNLNVVVLPAAGAGPNEDMGAAAVAAAKQLFGSSKYTTSVFETPNGKVGMYSGSTTVGATEPHDLVGGILIHNEKSYTITLSSETGKGAGFEKTFKDIFNTLKFK